MNHDEYVREGHFQYEAFARTVAAILQAAIDDSGEDFHLQQISFRAKSKTSLHRKLKERDLSESQIIESDLKDLAGCRLVFYTNTDVDRFLNSRLIFENFKIDFDASKIHHAVGKDRPADKLFFGFNYVVSLTDERLALPEYRKFRGLRCEVQIQTILNHAWSETTHDILYHRPDFGGFGTKQFAVIEARLTKIMNEYLLPAGYEFQAAQHDFERLRQGKELFDRNTIDALKTADNNNDRYEYLRRVKSDLLPYYDDVPSVAPELICSVIEAIKRARTAPVKEIETALGNMPGLTVEQVVNAGLEIIEDLQYIDIRRTFQVLCDLYVGASTDEERRRIIQATERLAHNDIEVWRQAGPIVQELLQESISALSDTERAAARPVVLTVAQQILDPEVTGSTWHFQSVSLHRGAVQPSETLGRVRSNVLDLLFRMYGEAKTDQEKRDIVHALDPATSLPGTGNYGDSLTAMVLDNTRRIVEFFADRTDTEQFELLQTIEHHYLWLYRRTKEIAQAQTADRNGKIAEKVSAVIVVIEQFRDRANSREQFVRFKTLVGYESVFPPEWGGEATDIEGRAAYRAARIAECVASVTNDRADAWYEQIRRCASVQSNDGATFPSFCEFLKQLAARSPAIMFEYLEKGDDVLSGFLPAILEGLKQSEQWPAALKLIERWVEQGHHLAAIARHLRLTKGAPADLMRRVGQKALDSKDLIVIIEIIAAVVASGAVDLVDSIVVPGIRHFTTAGDTRWVRAVWFMPELQAFVRTLSEAQCEVVLENLTLCARINHDDERILKPIAENFEPSVWRFLKSRLDQKTAISSAGHYEAIPYELRELRKPLSRDAGFAVDTVRSWYRADKRLFLLRGGKVLHNVFPAFSPELEAKLISIVQEGPEAIDFVLLILRAYQGETFLHGVCKEIVNSLPENDRRLGEVEQILESPGVGRGQFGFVEAYQRKKVEAEPWLSDARPKVCAFAEKCRRSLDRAIAAEQRRSEIDYELTRREWPEEEE